MRRALAVLGALALLIAVERLHSYHEPLDGEAAASAVVAREVLAGRALYTDVWDNRSPAVHAAHAVAQALAGFGPGAVYALGVLLATVTLLGVYAAGSALSFGIVGGLWAAAAWTLVSGDVWLHANRPTAEAMVNACAVWAFALLVRLGGRPPLPASPTATPPAGREGSSETLTGPLRRRRPPSMGATALRSGHPAQGVWGAMLATGVLLALASLYKPAAFALAVALLAAHVAWPHPATRRRRALIEAAVGLAAIAVAWGAMLGYFAAAGRARPFLDAVFGYGRFLDGHPLANLGAALVLSGPLPTQVHVMLPLAVLAALGAAAGRRRPWGHLVAFAVGGYAALALERFAAPEHFQVWLPVAAVGSGWAVGEIHAWRLHAPRWVPHAVGAAVLGLVLALRLPLYGFPADDWARIKHGEIAIAAARLGRELDALLLPGETFYHWGRQSGLYFASGRPPLAGPLSIDPLLAGPVAATLSTRVAAEIGRHEPEVVVIARSVMFAADVRHPVLDWIRPRYRPLRPALDDEPFVVLARRGGRLEAAALATPLPPRP